jgi:hypothetical protein
MGSESMKRLVGVASIALAALPASAQRSWRFPVTVEALQNVRAQTVETGRQARGVLYVRAAKPFAIKKGQRFLMVKAYSEGECRIQFENKEYDVSSCPWMDGFTDHQSDIFQVVPRRTGRKPSY